MSKFWNYFRAKRVTIPDGNDQPLTSDADGQRFVVNRGDASSVEGAPVLTIDNDDVSLRNAGRLATQGDTATVEINGDDARIVNFRGARIEAEDTAIEVNGEDAVIVNAGEIDGGVNGVSFSESSEDGLLFNRGVITSDSRAVEIDGEGHTLVNTGKILGTGDQRNGTVYADGPADDYEIVNVGVIDAGEGNQGAGISLELDEEVDAEVFNAGVIQGRGNAAAGTPLAGDGIRLASGVEGPSTFEGDITNHGTISSEGANGTVAGIRVANGVGFEGTLTNGHRGVVSGVQNGVYFGNADHNGGEFINRGKVTSDSRAVNLDGDELTFVNQGKVLGTGDQRNGTTYIDGTGDDITVENRGKIDAGEGNLGDGISVQVGAAAEDATNENIDIENSGTIQGRGQAAFDGGRLASNGSSGVRYFNGSGEAEATVTGSLVNSGTITAEVDVGFLGGVVVEDGVAFDGEIVNENGGVISGPRNGLYVGNAEHDLTIRNEGRIESGSRAVNLDGDNVTFRNSGDVIGVGDQRNGTTYIDGTGDDITIENRGTIDAGKGNSGDGISVQVGSAAEDATNENINIENSGTIQGRGQAAFDGGRLTPNGSSGVRFFNGSGQPEATVTGSVVNAGTISAEVDVGFLGGLVVEDGVAFDGQIVNEDDGLITGPRNGLYIGNASHNLTIENEGRIESGSRAVNLDGDNVSFSNEGEVVGIGDQRNGTLYLDGTADSISVENDGTIDAGEGNNGSGVSVQVGATSEDALNENINLVNDGLIQGRGDGNVPAGVRLFVGSGLETAAFEGSIVNESDGVIASETNAGILIEEGVIFNGTIENEGTIEGGNGLAIDAQGALGNIEVVNDGTLIGDVRLGDGNDSFVQNGDDDVVVSGGGGSDELIGGDGDDVLLGGSGGDRLAGGDGDDFLQGGGGSDVTDGGDGSDTASFVDIGVAVVANLSDAEVLDQTGQVVEQGQAVYFPGGPDGPRIVDSLVSIENLLGSANDDTLVGDDENNVLNGGGGNDILVGNDGSDTFVFEIGTEQDVVEDFEASNDLLDLSAFGFEDVEAVQDAAVEAEIDGQEATVIDLDGAAGADQVTLLGIAVNDLNSGNVNLDDEAGA